MVGYGDCSTWRFDSSVKEAINYLGKNVVIGENPDNIEKLWWKMWDTTTRALGGITHRALAGIDNALWDIKGKRLGVPVYELLGGRYRDKIRLYWSHCGTHRVFRPKVVQKPKIDSYDGIKKLGMEVVEEGFTALKTNIFNPESLDDSGPGSYREGIGTVVMDKQTLKDAVHLIRVFREAVGDEIDIILDAACRFNSTSAIKLARSLEPYDLLFLEDILDVPEGRAIAVDPITMETSLSGVFAGGDVVSGPATVIEAIVAGKTAAASINRYLKDVKS